MIADESLNLQETIVLKSYQLRKMWEKLVRKLLTEEQNNNLAATCRNPAQSRSYRTLLSLYLRIKNALIETHCGTVACAFTFVNF